MSIQNKIEAILLLGGDEIKIKDLCKFFSLSIDEIMPIIDELKRARKDSGINIEINGDLVYLVTNPIYGEVVNEFFEHETLSIIAYRQPITKSEIEAIRGVSVDRIIQNLEEKKFVRVCGKKEGTGRANLYEVTEKFLTYIGLSSITELPNYIDIKGRIEENGRDEDK